MPGTKESYKGAITYDDVITENETSMLVRIDGKDHWLPKSECEIEESHQMLIIPVWLAIARGIEGYLEDE